MALYSYIRDDRPNFRLILSRISLIFIILGMSLLFFALYPIIAFEIFYAPKFGTILSPIPADTISKAIETELFSVIQSSETDYTKASIWFPQAQKIDINQNLKTYNLSIPKLKIENAIVNIGGEDLSKSLIHFTGPAPGYTGNTVIFGHSTILWFYSPKDYKSIFSKLPDMSLDDFILIKHDNITYTYKVFDMKIIPPEDLSVLAQNTKESIISLITCVPPGTYLKRFVIRAKLVPL